MNINTIPVKPAWRREFFPLRPTDDQVTTSFKCSTDLMGGTIGDTELRRVLRTLPELSTRSQLFNVVMRLIVRFGILTVYKNPDGTIIGLKIGVTE
jgi:hypothetical protein